MNTMNLQKKLNKLQVEHVSEEEVDQLFYALEQKEMQLEEAIKGKKELEEEAERARQNSARAMGGTEPKFIEIHHHNDMSDDEEEGEAKEPPVDAS